MIDIIKAVMAATKVQHWPCTSNRASQLGHPCVRYLVYLRLDWDKATLPDKILKLIFEGGDLIQGYAEDKLRAAGFKLVETEGAIKDPLFKKYNITGHIDDMIVDGDKRYPLEIKSMSPYIWKAINSIDDMLNSRQAYLRKYPAQLTLYMLGHNWDEGVFYLVNKLTFEPKTIWMKLDYDYAEGLLQKAEAVNAFVDAKEYPDRIPYDEGVCGRCNFAHICLDKQVFGKNAFIEDAELEARIKRWMELKPAQKEYKELNEEINFYVAGREIVVGDFIVTGRKDTRGHWRKQIRRIPGKEQE